MANKAGKLDRILLKIIEIDEKVDQIQDEMKGFVTKSEFTTRMDEVMTIVNRLEKEQIVTNSRLDRIEEHIGLRKFARKNPA